ncbi:hypothetical protein [Weissella hellenica]|uniref:hypothetical protein n=1 Tax=Weissella hellenica TaxID=46256 RepID=UPI00388A897B
MQKFITILPLTLFILGLALIAVGSFLINTVLGVFVTGFILLLVSLLLGQFLNVAPTGDKQ